MNAKEIIEKVNEKEVKWCLHQAYFCKLSKRAEENSQYFVLEISDKEQEKIMVCYLSNNYELECTLNEIFSKYRPFYLYKFVYVFEVDVVAFKAIGDSFISFFTPVMIVIACFGILYVIGMTKDFICLHHRAAQVLFFSILLVSSIGGCLYTMLFCIVIDNHYILIKLLLLTLNLLFVSFNAYSMTILFNTSCDYYSLGTSIAMIVPSTILYLWVTMAIHKVYFKKF